MCDFIALLGVLARVQLAKARHKRSSDTQDAHAERYCTRASLLRAISCTIGSKLLYKLVFHRPLRKALDVKRITAPIIARAWLRRCKTQHIDAR